jgi:hypothetical protein
MSPKIKVDTTNPIDSELVAAYKTARAAKDELRRVRAVRKAIADAARLTHGPDAKIPVLDVVYRRSCAREARKSKPPPEPKPEPEGESGPAPQPTKPTPELVQPRRKPVRLAYAHLYSVPENDNLLDAPSASCMHWATRARLDALLVEEVQSNTARLTPEPGWLYVKTRIVIGTHERSHVYIPVCVQLCRFTDESMSAVAIGYTPTGQSAMSISDAGAMVDTYIAPDIVWRTTTAFNQTDSAHQIMPSFVPCRSRIPPSVLLAHAKGIAIIK